MIIESNKHYINAKGNVILVETCNLTHFPFKDENYCVYSKNGQTSCLVRSENDLICECIPDILDKYMDKDITQKEFIQQHIYYYTKVSK